LWGSSFLLIKLAVATVPPLTIAAGSPNALAALALILLGLAMPRLWSRRPATRAA